MKQVDTGDAQLSLIDDRVVIVETKAGVMLDRNKTRQFYEIVEQLVPGDYSLVINRKHDYRLMRFEVYSIANSHERLKGIALVVPKKTADRMAELEAPLCQKPFAKFGSLEEAVNWAQDLHRG